MLRARLIRMLAIASIFSLVVAGTARAALIFPRSISAFGGAVDSEDHSDLGDLSIGGGILTLTVAASDSCFETTTPTNSVSNAGKSISFYYFPGGAVNGGSRIVGKSINLVDFDADTIEDQTVVGTIQP